MIVVRRAGERVREEGFGQESWITFGPNFPKSRSTFGSMEGFREGRLIQGVADLEPLRETELITYVHEGTLVFQDSLGQTGVLRAGEFQRVTAGQGLRYSEANLSPIHRAHVFQIRLRPERLGLKPGHERRRCSVADRRGRLCCVASRDGANGSLVIHQDAALYSSILAPGQHVVHPLARGHGVWLHVVTGSLSVGSLVLNTGDGAEISEEASASMIILEPTEILLLNLGNLARRNSDRGKATTPELPRNGEV